MGVAGKHPERDIFIGLFFDPPGAPNPHAVPVEQELEHHGGVIGRLPPMKAIVFLGDLRQIQAVHHVGNEQSKVIRWEPLPDVRRKQQRLIRLVGFESLVCHEQALYRPSQKCKAFWDRLLGVA